jgi:hypothetical protein
MSLSEDERGSVDVERRNPKKLGKVNVSSLPFVLFLLD